MERQERKHIMHNSEDLLYQDVIRDVVFLYHAASDYGAIVPDLVISVGPYYAWFDNEEPLIVVGTALLFLFSCARRL
jgi:hypothetical protein